MHTTKRLFISLLFSGCLLQASAKYSDTLSITGNGYMYPSVDAENSPLLRKKGIVNWTSTKDYCRVFFYAKKADKISIGVKLQTANESTVQLTLDGKGKALELATGLQASYTDLPAGELTIADAGYHFIEIKGISKQGKNFPNISDIIIKSTEDNNYLYNKSEYRGAPSTHLRYPYPVDSTISWFYNEIEIPKGVNAVHAYYMTNGFADGYFGIQANSYTERRFIFSIWSNFKTDDPRQIPSDYAVRLLKRGKDVVAEDFGNEGSGGHSHLVFPWKNGTVYKLLVGAKPMGDHTIYTGYYFTPEDGKWHLISQWDKAKSGGRQLASLYSFVENFGPNGNDYFMATYGNQWAVTNNGSWIELTKAVLTTTASPEKHQRYDYGGGVENNWFYMYSGGFSRFNNMAPKSSVDRKPIGQHPDIDFSKLPTE